MWCDSSPSDPAAPAAAGGGGASAAPDAGADAAAPADAGADAGAAATAPSAAAAEPAPADCGPDTVTPCPCAGAAVTSQMVMTEPPDRARTRMAVGERVELTYSLGAATWAPADHLSAANGASVTFTAPDVEGTLTITATGGGCSAAITLTVVEPDTVRMIKRFSRANRVLHHANSLTLQFSTNVFLGPDDVNFHRVQVIESEALATASGVLTANGGLGHHPAATGTGFTTHVQAGMGTFLSEHDNVGVSNPAPWVAPQTGAVLIPIPWRWRVGAAGPFRRLHTVNQRFNVDATGVIAGTKAGARAAVNFADPSSVE